jgi:beta-glucosidase
VDGQLSSNDPTVNVSFDIANTGSRSGAEVAQVYVQEVNPRLPRPVKELKGFARVQVDPGKTQTVHLTLNRGAFAYFDPDQEKWIVDPGVFNILVGSSSRDIQLQGSVDLK